MYSAKTTLILISLVVISLATPAYGAWAVGEIWASGFPGFITANVHRFAGKTDKEFFIRHDEDFMVDMRQSTLHPWSAYWRINATHHFAGYGTIWSDRVTNNDSLSCACKRWFRWRNGLGSTFTGGGIQYKQSGWSNVVFIDGGGCSGGGGGCDQRHCN